MKKYLITDPAHYTQEASSFAQNLRQALSKHQPEYALYRDKQNPDAALLASTFIATSKEFAGLKSFLHSDVALAELLGADGVHLTYCDKERIKEAKQKGLEVVVSTHTLQEALDVEALGADALTYSPIFATPNKGEPKGVEDLKDLLEKVNCKVFALGGIVTEQQLRELETTQVYGFASIRYFIS